MTFYGNERCEIAGPRRSTTPRAGRVGWLRRWATHARASVGGPPTTPPTATRRPPSRTAIRCRRRASHAPHESPMIMVAAGRRARVARRGDGLLEPPVQGRRLPHQWLEPVFRGVPRCEPVVVRQGTTLETSRCCSRVTGLGSRTCSTGAASRTPIVTRSTTKLGRSRRCSATRTTTTRASRASSTARSVRSPASSTGWSTPRSSTAPSTASAGSFAQCRRRRRNSCRTASCAATRSASRSARSRVLLYLVLWAGR